MEPVSAILAGVGLVSSIGSTISQLFGASEQDRYQRQMDSLRRDLASRGAEALERDAANILEVGEQRASDLLGQARERMGDYARQRDWRVGDIMRGATMGAAGRAGAAARSGVMLGSGSAGAQVRQVSQQGQFTAGRERFIADENIRRTDKWSKVSAERIRQQAQYDAERITNARWGAAARMRLGADFPSAPGPNYAGIALRGAASAAQYGANLYDSFKNYAPHSPGGGWDESDYEWDMQ